MRNTDIQFVLVSAAQADQTEQNNIIRNDLMQHDLARTGLNYHPAIGSYKGNRERSWLVLVGRNDDYREALALARAYQQESVLAVALDGTAELIYLRHGTEGPDVDRSIKLGKWTPIDKAQAEQLDSWTLYGNEYFTAREQEYANV